MMTDQKLEFEKSKPARWLEKKEALQRLAEALENTAPPLQNKKDENSHLTIQPVGSALWRKFKTFLARIFNIHKNHYTTL